MKFTHFHGMVLYFLIFIPYMFLPGFDWRHLCLFCAMLLVLLTKKEK